MNARRRFLAAAAGAVAALVWLDPGPGPFGG